MKAAMAAVLVLLVASTAHGLVLDDRPVSKVITLLKDMVVQLTKEADEDKEVYDAFSCWCETNEEAKSKSIAEGTQHADGLTAAIEEYTGTSSLLNTEIGNLNKEIDRNQRALDTATALREKQYKEFNVEEKDALMSINSLKSAVQVLSKQHGDNLLQTSSGAGEELPAVVASLSDILRKHGDVAEGISPEQRRAVDNFLQQSDAAPQSGEIYGVLKQMKETFETNLASSQKEEEENNHAYEDMKAAKTGEITAGQSSVDTKTLELAEADSKNAQSKEDLEDTQASIAEDTAFLTNLREKCTLMDKEYQERTKTRTLETQAVSKALEFLSSDDAHDMFTRTFTSLLQKSQSERRGTAVTKVLRAVAKKVNDPRLSNLAMQVRLDKFTKVKETLNDMIAKLTEEKNDDIAHKDFCVEQFNAQSIAMENKEREKAETLTSIDEMTTAIDTLAKEIEVLKSEVAEMQIQLKKAGEDREKSNKDFQMTVADQRATQKLLLAALNALKGFYDKAALVQAAKKGQATARHGQAPPPGFKDYKDNAASGGVMRMIQNIIDDAKNEEDLATRAEGEAQKSYEIFVTDTNAAIESKTKGIVDKMDVKAKTEGKKADEIVHRDEILASLEQMTQENNDLHRSCDFLLKNFDLRASARDEEIEALKQGVAMFSGASYASLLQD